MDILKRIEEAFEKLEIRKGFANRPDQRQLSLLISDCIGDAKSGAFEAPTGLGKSLACLIPALAHGLGSGKRTVVATYTNVLAEQYWRSDLPLALSLFEDARLLNTQFLIGRQRYACLAALEEMPRSAVSEFKASAALGIEAELRTTSRKFGRELTELWHKVAAPPVCAGRLCSHYQDCYYYRARRGAEKASVVITNHSVVLQDALLKKASDGELSMLGDYDFLVVDEAHDFTQAAVNSLEFELSESKLNVIAAIAQRMQASVQPLSLTAGQPHAWNGLCDGFREKLASLQRKLSTQIAGYGHGILQATPEELLEHPQVRARRSGDALGQARELSEEIAHLIIGFVGDSERMLSAWRKEGDISAQQLEDGTDAIHNYCMYLREFGVGCHSLLSASAEDYAGVTYSGSGSDRAAMLRRDAIGLSEPLRELIWDQVPSVSLSATLAVDGNFDFYCRMTGARPDFSDVLPSPFDFATQAALYLPKPGRVPDPTLARKNGTERQYFEAVAREVSSIIFAADGRTLVLFHSRREMEEVHARIVLPEELTIHVQRGASAGWVGERFKKEERSSLFALRSFWSGFDAPGATLSCVVLVRVPFEVPVDPPQIARMAWLQTQGLDPFASYSLPNAKMLMRQGAGRLIRRVEDQGVIAVLDSRLRTKNYGEEILSNLPAGLRTYDDIEQALIAVGLEPYGGGVLSLD